MVFIVLIGFGEDYHTDSPRFYLIIFHYLCIVNSNDLCRQILLQDKTYRGVRADTLKLGRYFYYEGN